MSRLATPPQQPRRLTYEERRGRASRPELWPLFIPPPHLPPGDDLDDVLDDLLGA
jgi:hypothetical protein